MVRQWIIKCCNRLQRAESSLSEVMGASLGSRNACALPGIAASTLLKRNVDPRLEVCQGVDDRCHDVSLENVANAVWRAICEWRFVK